MGECPFDSHNIEPHESPCFVVNELRNEFRCFKCGVGGGAIQFLARVEHIDYDAAFAKLKNEFEPYALTKKKAEFHLNKVLGRFRNDSSQVHSLNSFDVNVLNFCLERFRRLEQNVGLKEIINDIDELELEEVFALPERVIKAIKTIEEEDQNKNLLASSNRSVILLLSCFSKSCKELLTESINYLSEHEPHLLTKTIQVHDLFSDTISNQERILYTDIGKSLVGGENVNFSDLEDVLSIFKENIISDFTIRDNAFFNIIVAQASKEYMTNPSELTKSKFLIFANNYPKKTILRESKTDDSIYYTKSDFIVLKNGMERVLREIICSVVRNIK